MKTALAASILLLASALGGCKQPASDTGSAATAPATPETAPAPAQPTAPLDKAQVLASGKTGFWGPEGDALCKGRARSRMTLAWNVKDATHGKVVVWMDLTGHGKERAAKSGGPVGVFTTGPWVKPGAVFVLREVGTRRELGRLKVGGKQC